MLIENMVIQKTYERVHKRRCSNCSRNVKPTVTFVGVKKSKKKDVEDVATDLFTMCKNCLKHGAGGKWYFNARNYSNELAEEMNLKEYMQEQWKNFEQITLRKIGGFTGVGLGYKLKMPIIGRIVKYFAEKTLHSEKKKRNPFRAEGHFGQVVPLEEIN